MREKTRSKQHEREKTVAMDAKVEGESRTRGKTGNNGPRKKTMSSWVHEA